MNSSERVLIWVRGHSEGAITVDLLGRDGLESAVCGTVDELCTLAAEGAGLALIAEEMMDAAALDRLQRFFHGQPAWSDFPIVCFSSEHRSASSRPLRELGNVTFLERPVHVRSMLAAVHAALRSRRRQYEARKAIESRDSFLAMLSHELRNPLAAITLASKLVASQREVATPGLEVIDRQSRHLTRLVDELLDVARFTHGKVKLKRAPIDPREPARAAFSALQPRAQEEQLSYEMSFDADATWFVNADEQRLQQVFSNLLTNAVKYTPAGGEIRFELRIESDTLIAEVRDNGLGVAPSLLPRLFDPFLQADSSLDRSEGGLGLGLSLVKNVVELHGGQVSAESAGVGRGSTFRVQLPLAAPPPASGIESSVPALRATPRRILVVEDNEDIRELFTASLERLGHTVEEAADGPNGLARLLEQPPEVAFIDIGLPGFDGLELAQRARAAGSATFLVALTGYGQAEDRKRTEAVGFDDHLVKPVDESEVERVLSDAAHRSEVATSLAG